MFPLITMNPVQNSKHNITQKHNNLECLKTIGHFGQKKKKGEKKKTLLLLLTQNKV